MRGDLEIGAEQRNFVELKWRTGLENALWAEAFAVHLCFHYTTRKRRRGKGARFRRIWPQPGGLEENDVPSRKMLGGPSN